MIAQCPKVTRTVVFVMLNGTYISMKIQCM